MGAELFHPDGLTDRHGEAKSRLSQFCKRAENSRDCWGPVTTITKLRIQQQGGKSDCMNNNEFLKTLLKESLGRLVGLKSFKKIKYILEIISTTTAVYGLPATCFQVSISLTPTNNV